jgi:DNA-binding protein H-NS
MAMSLAKLKTNELRKLIKSAEVLIAKREREERQTLVQEMRELASKRGFDLNDLLKLPLKARPTGIVRSGKKVKPKFRHPDQRGVTWSGRGRKPKWIVEAEAAGKLDKLRVRS